MKLPVLSTCLMFVAPAVFAADLKVDGNSSFGVAPTDDSILCAADGAETSACDGYIASSPLELCLPDGIKSTACPPSASGAWEQRSLTTSGGSPLQFTAEAKFGVSFDGDEWNIVDGVTIHILYTGTTDSDLSFGAHAKYEH